MPFSFLRAKPIGVMQARRLPRVRSRLGFWVGGRCPSPSRAPSPSAPCGCADGRLHGCSAVGGAMRARLGWSSPGACGACAAPARAHPCPAPPRPRGRRTTAASSPGSAHTPAAALPSRLTCPPRRAPSPPPTLPPTDGGPRRAGRQGHCGARRRPGCARARRASAARAAPPRRGSARRRRPRGRPLTPCVATASPPPRPRSLQGLQRHQRAAAAPAGRDPPLLRGLQEEREQGGGGG